MTVLERLKAAGYDPAVSLFPDSIGNAGSMECERVQIRTFFCRPREKRGRHRGDRNRDDPFLRRLDPSIPGRLAAQP